MFELSKVEVKCTSASTNSENQGQSEDTRLGLSMYVEYQGSNEFLDMFDAKLRPALYERAANDSQEDLTGHLPTPKFKLEKPIAWPLVCLGYTAIIHPEFSVNDEIAIEDVKVDKFHFTLQNDGVVGFKFRIYLHPDLDIVGPLAFLEKHVADLDRHTDLVMRSQKELDEFRPNFEAVVQAAHPIDPLTCPHCAGAIMLGDDNQLIAYEPPPERDEGAASVEEYERALGLLERTLANRQRDLQQSKDAKVELDALLAQCPEVDQGQIEKLRGAVHALREQRESQRLEVEQMDQAARAAKAAESTTQKAAEHHADVQAWGRIATALAPDGIPGDLLTEALQPFNERLRLSSADTGWRAPFITADMEILADNRHYGLLSESEQWRCDAMIAEAIAYLSKLHLLMLDRFDVLDMQGRGELMGWLMVLADEGEIDTALLFGTLKSLPAIQPDVVSSHWLENGSIQQQQAEKAA